MREKALRVVLPILTFAVIVGAWNYVGAKIEGFPTPGATFSAMGSAWGSWVNRSDDPRMHMILAIATGIAVFVSVPTAAECIRLRRQLDAVLVLGRKTRTGLS